MDLGFADVFISFAMRSPSSSADRRETLSHDGKLAEFYNASPKIRGGGAHQKWGKNMQNFGRFLYHFRLWLKRGKISKMGKRKRAILRFLQRSKKNSRKIWFTNHKELHASYGVWTTHLKFFGEFVFQQDCHSAWLYDKLYFSDINVSQSNVATRLRWGGIFTDHFIAHFLELVTVKEFRKLGQYFTKLCVEYWGLGAYFFGPPYSWMAIGRPQWFWKPQFKL